MLPLFTLHSVIPACFTDEWKRWNKHGYTACFLQLALKTLFALIAHHFSGLTCHYYQCCCYCRQQFYSDYFSKSYGFRSLPDNNFRGINAPSFVSPLYSTFVARQASAVAALLRNNQHKMKTRFSITDRQ
ncbi:MAG: hypothetical protein WC756_15460 [Taibaiella sp.]|jgi:hypothetical protein